MKISTSLFTGCCVIATSLTAAADVTSAVENLGNTHNNANSPDKGGSALSGAIGYYKNRIYVGRTKDQQHADIVYLDLDTGLYDVIRKSDGSRFDNKQEKILGFQVGDHNLLIQAEDGSPNNNTGFMTDETADGWRLVDFPGDQVHGLNQFKFEGYYFATVNGGWSPFKNQAVPFIRYDNNLGPYEPGVDVFNEFLGQYTGSRDMYKMWGHLFATGYTWNGPNDRDSMLIHYTGIESNGWEVTYDTTTDLHPEFDGYRLSFKGVFDLGDGGLIWNYRTVLRVSKGSAEGYSGTYPIPVGENIVSTKAVEMFKKYGYAYIVEENADRLKIRASSDLTNWNTLLEFDIDLDRYKFTIAGEDIYFTGDQNLYRIPGSAFGGLPTDENASPVAVSDSYQTNKGDEIFIFRGSEGLLANDSDGNDDVLYISSFSNPSKGTLEMEKNGTFTYSPDSGYEGVDRFTYTVSDGISSASATVTITVGSGGPAEPVSPSESALDANGRFTLGNDVFGASGQDGAGGSTKKLTINSDGSSARLEGNAWKYFPLNYTVTEDTLLKVTISGSDTGELLGIALDNNTTPTDTRRAFRLGGSDYADTQFDAWGWKISPHYNANDPATTYVIAVGDYFTGSVSNLLLIADDDAGSGSANVTFSNIKIYEARSGAGTTRIATADAFVRGGTYDADNFGDAEILAVKDDANSSYDRLSFLQFDLSGISGPVDSATVYLTVVGGGAQLSTAAVQLKSVTNDAWTESGITWSNKPASSTVLGERTGFSVGDVFAVDVTEFINDQLAGDSVASLEIRSKVSSSEKFVNFASRGNSVANAHPRLVLMTQSELLGTYETLASSINWGNTSESLRGPDADPDGDGITNLIELGFGQDPTVSESIAYPIAVYNKTSGTTGATVTLSHPKQAGTGILFQLEYSDDLSTWSSNGVSAESYNADTGLYKKSYTVPTGKKALFYRLKASLE